MAPISRARCWESDQTPANRSSTFRSRSSSSRRSPLTCPARPTLHTHSSPSFYLTGIPAMGDVYVVGIDMIKFGRFPDRGNPALAAEAALMALDDCGLTIKDMQALYCGNVGEAAGMVGQRMLAEIG